ncbi:hypothetical protein ACA910_022529 [Epithemia clementina (nom. ined.)]
MKQNHHNLRRLFRLVAVALVIVVLGHDVDGVVETLTRPPLATTTKDKIDRQQERDGALRRSATTSVLNELTEEIDQLQQRRQLDIFLDTGSSTSMATATATAAAPTQNKSAIEMMLTTNYRDGLVFYDESSYSMKALRYVEATSRPGMKDWRIAQRYALACIYYATNAISTPYSDSFLGQTGLAFPWLRKWAGGTAIKNECQWPGVVCTNTLTDSNGKLFGPVLEINLASNMLMGTLPIEVTILRNTLQVLDLENNLIYNNGAANVWWLGELTKLQVLNLGKNAFSGGDQQQHGLPAELGNLVNLRELNLEATLFFGRLDGAIFSTMTQLEYLDLGGLALNGPLPTSLKRLPNLRYVYLDDTDLRGNWSTYLDGTRDGGFPQLVEFWADQNPQLRGTLPSTLTAITTLRSLSLSNCGLTGSLPSELGRMSNTMKQMWLHNNKFTGTIPTDLGNLVNMERLFLHGNDFTGTMPSSICLNRFGSLESLGADCDYSGTSSITTTTSASVVEVTCSTTFCCTCCGSSCLGQ